MGITSSLLFYIDASLWIGYECVLEGVVCRAMQVNLLDNPSAHAVKHNANYRRVAVEQKPRLSLSCMEAQ